MATILPRKKARVKKSKIPPRDTLTEQQRKEIEESFDILDTDGSGEECDEGFVWDGRGACPARERFAWRNVGVGGEGR